MRQYLGHHRSGATAWHGNRSLHRWEPTGRGKRQLGRWNTTGHPEFHPEDVKTRRGVVSNSGSPLKASALIEVRLLGWSPGSVAFKRLKRQPPGEQADALAAGAWLVEF